MAYVVTSVCVDCKYTNCAAVCPVEAFREGPDRLFIDPDACIDCNACVPECPVHAIHADVDVPATEQAQIALNAEEAPKHPVISVNKEPLLGPKCKPAESAS